MKKLVKLFFTLTTLTYAAPNAAYNGSSGLLETPNARIMPDWSMRGFINVDQPYMYYGFALTPLPFLETNFHMTQIDGINVNAGYGDYKDKSISLKLLLKKEGKYLPAIVFGADDIWGTALYTSKYLVMSKRFSYVDVSLGYAMGRLGGEDLRKYDTDTTNSGSTGNNALNFLKTSGWSGGKVFAGAEVAVTPKLTYLLEYNPIDYKLDKTNPFFTGSEYDLPTSKVNMGLRYKLTNNYTVTASWQRGNQFAFGLNYQFGFDKNGMFKHLEDKKWRAKPEKVRAYQDYNTTELSEKLSNEVAAESFANVQTAVHKNAIWSEIDNTRYNLDMQALGRALDTLNEVAPKKYDTFYMTLKERGIAHKTVVVNRKEFNAYQDTKVSDSYMQDAISFNSDTKALYDTFAQGTEPYKTDVHGTKRFNYFIAPGFKSFLNSINKPIAVKLSVQLGMQYDLADGIFLKGNIQHPLFNDIKNIHDNNAEALETNDLAIRSQMLDYYKYDDTQLKTLTLDVVRNAPLNSFAKVEVGYFDLAFAGIDVEWYKPLYDERFGIGLQYQRVYKRHIENMFKVFEDSTFDAKFINIYALLSPQYDLHATAKIGQFLAGDKGARIDIARNYRQFTLGAFATVTNSDDVFTNSQNRGYIDKGVYLKVPLDVFTYKNVKGRTNYGFSPWTRDVGQFADTAYSLYPMLNSENNMQIMKKNINHLKK